MLPDDVIERVFSYICCYWAEYGLPPTYSKIAKDLDLKLGTVRRCLDVLEAKGKLSRDFNAKPAIRQIIKSNGKAN